jgi:hypothetical protein
MFEECFKRVQSSLAQYLSPGECLNIEVINCTDLVDGIVSIMGDHGGYNLSAYALAIHVHIYNSLINVGCLHILPHIENLQKNS